MKIQDIKEGYFITDATIKSLTWEQWEQFYDRVICNIADYVHSDASFYYHSNNYHRYPSGFWEKNGSCEFGTTDHSYSSVAITKQDILNMLQELNEQQGHNNNSPFTIDMLKPGMFCKQRNGHVWVVAEHDVSVEMTRDVGYTDSISDCYEHDLFHNNGSYSNDIMSISLTYDFASPVWERKEPSPDTLAHEKQERATCLEERVELLEDQLQKMMQMMKEKG